MFKKRLYLLFLLWGVTFGLLALLPEGYASNHVMLVMLSLVLMVFFRTKINFLIVLSTIIIYGFGLTIYAQMEDIFSGGQYILIAAHLLLTASLLSLWLIVHDVKSLVEENKSLEERIGLLEKFDWNTKALSMPEFMERGLLIETAMRRRSEKGRLIYFNVKDSVPLTARDSLRHYFINTCLHTVREEFDLVTSPSQSEVFVFLQGTNTEGEAIVIERLKDKLREYVNYIELPYHITSYEIGNLKKIMEQFDHQRGA
ncbi:hypothetical protein [Jeotgalibacillus terrae]|uniref:GGDEF domain-containing protein n=1 Tax=Jeotgalibacillus terrae TaxID=587735 RepID=A0ABW5ZEF5_9BACL|nr:hypothetical protein [Jeotgalibacillus terrae]MBM7577867.1 hypothetical protein [Jeotgalibacillus terrae]